MRVKVHGLKAGGAHYERIVTIYQLMASWGPWAMRVFHARRHSPLVVGDRAVWVEIVE